jgi:uncharacterized membrane protein YkoI
MVGADAVGVGPEGRATHLKGDLMYTLRKTLIGAGLVGTTLVGGAVGAAFLTGTANAAESTTATASDSSAPAAASDSGKARPAETPLTGDTAEKVKATALAAVPDGTIDRVETDSDGSPYEAHMTKADGSHVTVKVDANFAVTSIDADSAGKGGKGGGGHGGGSGGPHSANGITEAPLTGDAADKAGAAALAAVPGATVDRAETDADGAANEVHMTKADGSHVTVKLDANFNVVSVDNG